jgi:hypothetical protein
LQERDAFIKGSDKNMLITFNRFHIQRVEAPLLVTHHVSTIYSYLIVSGPGSGSNPIFILQDLMSCQCKIGK